MEISPILWWVCWHPTTNPSRQYMIFDYYDRRADPFAGLAFGYTEIVSYCAGYLGSLVDAPAATYRDSKSVTLFHP